MIDAKTPEGKHVVRCSWIRSIGYRKNFRIADSVSERFKHKGSRMNNGNVAAVDCSDRTGALSTRFADGAV